jgi:outer membrane biosynthesis protein TonB
MSERNSDRWISLAQSVLLHGAVVALLAYGWWTYKQTKTPPPARSLAIEAVALDMGDAPKTAAPPRPEPLPPEPQPEPEPPPEETGPPAPTPEEVARREEETRRAEEARKAEEQRIE